MASLLFDRTFRLHLLLFVIFNTFFYLFLVLFNSSVPFNFDQYSLNAHHFLPDPRINHQPFSLLSALAQYDSQWYLKIASTGYTYSPNQNANISDKSLMGNSAFAYFPLFPLIIRVFDLFTKHLELSAFIVTQVFLLANFISLYFVTSKLFSASVAQKTVWLFFLFPFSVFFRSYYAEGVQLFCLIWFSYFVIKKNLLPAAFFLGALGISKGITLPLGLVYLVALKRLPLPRILLYLLIGFLPLFLWIVFNLATTQDPFFFFHVLNNWFPQISLPYPILNLITILNLEKLPLHSVHSSQIDALSVCLLAFLLYKSYPKLPRVLWLISLVVWAVPLFTRDLASFSRYQSVSFPVFVFLAQNLKPFPYLVTLSASLILFLITSLYFVNWYWIG